MSATECLKAIIELFNSTKVKYNNKKLFELSVVMTSELKETLKNLDIKEIPFDINGDYFKPQDIELEVQYKLEMDPHLIREAGVLIYNCWDEFFSFPRHLSQSPEAFYIHKTRDAYLGSDENINKTVKCYIDTLHLISSLNKCAEHTETTADKRHNVIFLHKARLEIECDYELKDIEHGIDGITSIVTWLAQDTHQDQRKSIFKAALYDILKSEKKSRRFRYLVTNFGIISTQIIENYNLYVSEFSFDDVRLEYQEKKREYLTKINETFSSIQTKALGIPISIALVALRLSSQKPTQLTLATDFLLFSAACIYSLMMILLIFNQKHTLKSIKHEYIGQITRLKKKYPKQHEQIKIEFNELDSRQRFQQWQLNIFAFLTFTFLLLVDHYLSFDLSQYILDTFPSISSSKEWVNELMN